MIRGAEGDLSEREQGKMGDLAVAGHYFFGVCYVIGVIKRDANRFSVAIQRSGWAEVLKAVFRATEKLLPQVITRWISLV